MLSYEGLEVFCTGLDTRTMLLNINKTYLGSSRSVQHRPDETAKISNKEYISYYTKEVLAQDKEPECMVIWSRLRTYNQIHNPRHVSSPTMLTKRKVKDAQTSQP
jgi:hypothetical protein